MVKKAIVATLACVLAFMLIVFALWSSITPAGKAFWNTWFHGVQKADDATSYETRKKVEDTCRAMVSSYESDLATIALYDGSPDQTKQELADNAKIRANRTASTYNHYVLQNSYVWRDNVPADIRANLELVE